MSDQRGKKGGPRASSGAAGKPSGKKVKEDDGHPLYQPHHD